MCPKYKIYMEFEDMVQKDVKYPIDAFMFITC